MYFWAQWMGRGQSRDALHRLTQSEMHKFRNKLRPPHVWSLNLLIRLLKQNALFGFGALLMKSQFH